MKIVKKYAIMLKSKQGFIADLIQLNPQVTPPCYALICPYMAVYKSAKRDSLSYMFTYGGIWSCIIMTSEFPTLKHI